MTNYKISRYTAFFAAAILLILFSISCVSATDPNTTQDQSTLNSVQSFAVTATNDRYVNIKTGNDSWDGTSATHTNGTVGPKQHINNGLTVSVNSGTLYIAAGTYKENKLTITKNLTISGEGKTNTTIDATGSSLIFWIKPGTIVTIKNLNITNGTSTSTDFSRNGGGIYNEGTLTIDNCIFYNNHAKDASDAGGAAGDDASAAGNGGAIYNKGTLTITNSEFSSNYAGQGGDASATHNSSTGGSGGAIYNAGTILNVQACTFRNNYAGRGGASSGTHDGKAGGSGGAIYNTGTINNILSCTFTTNHAGTGGATQNGAAANPGTGGNGGAIYSNGTVTITSSTFDGNYAGNGGEGTDIQDGATGGYGGAIYNNGLLTISNSEIKNGHAGTGGAGPGAAKDGADGKGGAISNIKTLTITNCNIHNNNATYGGGIHNSGSLTLQDSQIHDNTASDGAGIFNENQITITNCQTYNNKASDNGGGIWNSATLTLANLTINNNTAGNNGGGIYNNGILTLNNFTITNNTANYGGGIGNANKLKVYNSNITSNTATTHGGGIYNTNLFYIVNTQVTSNTPDNIYGSTNCVVNNRTTELYSTIKDAISNASPNDTLLIQTGTYGENLDITKNINLIGAGISSTIIDGQQNNRCINIGGAYKVVITDLTITNGLNNDGDGGGIWNSGNLTLKNVQISKNACTITNAKSTTIHHVYGGGIYNSGNLTLNNCSIYKNYVWIVNSAYTAKGGGIFSIGNLTVINCTFNGNYAANGGEGSGGGDGGAIYTTGNLTVTNTTFQNNNVNTGSNGAPGFDFVGGHGGAIYNTGNMTGTNNIFKTNHANYLISTNTNGGHLGGGYGGAIYNLGSVNITNNTFDSNTGVYGGAIYNNGNLTDANNNYTNNNATGKLIFYGSSPKGDQYSLSGGYGGAIHNDVNGNLTITNDTFTNNISTYGGAISDKSKYETIITNSNFNSNTVQAVDENGNPITYNTIDMTTYQITETILAYAQAIAQFSYNLKLFTGSSIGIVLETTGEMVQKVTEHTIQATGGAIFLDDSSNLNINNCTFNNNTATIGGAINNLGNGTLTVTNINFSNNAASLGGAIYSSNIGSLFVKNSLFNSNIGGNNGAIFFGGTTSNLWAECNITENIFKNNTAIFGTVFYNGINGTSHSYLNFNRIYGTNNYDVFNEYALNKIDAKYNWWGSNYGPNTYSTYSSDLNIDTSHYMVLKINSPTDMTYGENATISTDMLHDNTGVYQDPKYGVIPDGVTVKLNTTNGNISPDSVTLVNGTASETYFANGSTGTAVIYAIVDNDERYPSNATINIQKIPTTTHNVYGQYSGAVGSNVTFTAKVTDNYNNPVNEGTVTFKVGNVNLTANVVNGNAIYIWTIPSTIGNSSIYTTYNGDSIYASSNDPYQGQLVVVPSADVVLTKTINGEIKVGQNLNATVTAENKGPDAATNVVFTNSIPPQFRFVDASVDKGTWTYVSATNIFTWNIGNLGVEEIAHLFLTLKALQAGSYSLSSNLASATYDPNLDNHMNPLKITVTVPGKNKNTGKESSVNAAGKTVGMQKTGIPIIALVLALLMVLGGLFRSKRK